MWSRGLIAILLMWLRGGVTAAPGDPGTLDLGFGSSNTVDSAIQSFALQPDGRVLIGGSFNAVLGQPRPRLARLHEDGTLDLSFNAGQAAPVFCVAALPNGKVLVGGSFLSFDGRQRNSLVRLLPDGRVDSDFKPPWSPVPTGIRRILVRGDGRFYIVGDFTQYGGHPTVNVALVQENGAVDTSFQSSVVFGAINSIALGPDPLTGPDLYVGGVAFNFPPQENRRFIGKMDALTGAFRPEFSVPVFPHILTGAAYQMLPLSTGEVLVAGVQGGGNGTNVFNGMVRVLANGSLDESFKAGPVPNPFEPQLAGQPFLAFARLPDGRIFAGGQFNSVQGSAHSNLVQLLSNGTVDPAFAPGGGPNNSIQQMAVQPDGKVLISGFFTQFGGVARPFLARIHGNGSSPILLDPPHPQTAWEGDPVTLTVRAGGDPDPTITWYRGSAVVGTGSTLKFSSLQSSDAGDYFVRLVNSRGAVESAPATLTVKSGPPKILRQPTDAAVALQAVAQFEVEVEGSRPFKYQWFENGLLMLGETNALLSVPVSNQSLYGNTYHAIVNNPRGAIVTGEAQLQPSLEGGLDVEFSYLAQFAKTTTPQLDDFHLNLRSARCLARQPDGHVIIGGGMMTLPTRSFSVFPLSDFNPKVSFAAFGITQNSNHLVRLNAAGDLDPGDLGTRFLDGPVNDLAVAPDGSYYAVGAFSKFGNTTRPGILRFRANGTFDPGFNVSYLPTNATFSAIAVQSDGRVVVTGTFTNLGGLPRNRVARLLENGAPDSTFNATLTSVGLGAVLDLAVQADHKVLIAGAGTFLESDNGGRQAPQLVRLNADGSWDEEFDTRGGAMAGTTDFNVRRILIQPDQRILIAGQFERFGGSPNTNLARLFPDGSSDPNFRAPSGLGLQDIALAPDGKIYLASSVPMPWKDTTRMGRLHSDGEPDPSWLPASGKGSSLRSVGTVQAVMVQPDGEPIFAGDFQPAFYAEFASLSGLTFPPWVDGAYRWAYAIDGGWVAYPYGNARHAVDGLVRFLGDSAVPGNLLIMNQPKGAILSVANSNYVMSVSAIVPGASASYTYQWMRNGLVLPGQTNGYLMLSPLSVDLSGDYSVLVTAETGYGPGQNVLSQTAKVRIVPSGQLLGKIGVVNGAFQWIISPGDGGVFTAADLANLQVLASTNLVDWQPLVNVLQLENGAIKILDPDAATISHRFYQMINVGP